MAIRGGTEEVGCYEVVAVALAVVLSVFEAVLKDSEAMRKCRYIKQEINGVLFSLLWQYFVVMLRYGRSARMRAPRTKLPARIEVRRSRGAIVDY